MKTLILVLAFAFSTSAFAGAGVNTVGSTIGNAGIVNTVNTANVPTGTLNYNAVSQLTFNHTIKDLNPAAKIETIYAVLSQAAGISSAFQSNVFGLLNFNNEFKDAFVQFYGVFNLATFLAKYNDFSSAKYVDKNGSRYWNVTGKLYTQKGSTFVTIGAN